MNISEVARRQPNDMTRYQLNDDVMTTDQRSSDVGNNRTVSPPDSLALYLRDTMTSRKTTTTISSVECTPSPCGSVSSEENNLSPIIDNNRNCSAQEKPIVTKKLPVISGSDGQGPDLLACSVVRHDVRSSSRSSTSSSDVTSSDNERCIDGNNLNKKKTKTENESLVVLCDNVKDCGTSSAPPSSSSSMISLISSSSSSSHYFKQDVTSPTGQQHRSRVIMDEEEEKAVKSSKNTAIAASGDLYRRKNEINTKRNVKRNGVNGSLSSSLPPPLPERHDSLTSDDQDQEEELKMAPWFQAGIPREIALEILGREPVGAFMVRESTSRPHCFALSLRVPLHFQTLGIAHYLILNTNRGYKIKGFTKEFSTLTALITHHSVMPELLPCPLSLSRYNANFIDNDNSSCFDDDDPDYETLSDFRKMMSELNV